VPNILKFEKVLVDLSKYPGKWKSPSDEDLKMHKCYFATTIFSCVVYSTVMGRSRSRSRERKRSRSRERKRSRSRSRERKKGRSRRSRSRDRKTRDRRRSRSRERKRYSFFIM